MNKFDKFEERCQKFGWQSQYAKLDSDREFHHERFKKYIESLWSGHSRVKNVEVKDQMMTLDQDATDK